MYGIDKVIAEFKAAGNTFEEGRKYRITYHTSHTGYQDIETDVIKCSNGKTPEDCVRENWCDYVADEGSSEWYEDDDVYVESIEEV